MDKPIERTIKWDRLSRCWRDAETGIDVRHMSAPYEPGERPIAPSQPNDDQVQRISNLIDAVREDWLPALERKLTERLRGIARDEATHVLANATIPQFPAYFVEKQLLVTYEWAKYLADLAEERAIERVLKRLPRWLRWLIR